MWLHWNYTNIICIIYIYGRITTPHKEPHVNKIRKLPFLAKTHKFLSRIKLVIYIQYVQCTFNFVCIYIHVRTVYIIIHVHIIIQLCTVTYLYTYAHIHLYVCTQMGGALSMGAGMSNYDPNSTLFRPLEVSVHVCTYIYNYIHL